MRKGSVPAGPFFLISGVWIKENPMRKVLDGLYRFSGGMAAFCILTITVLVFAQVILNLTDRISGMLFGSAIGLTIPSYADFTGFFLAAASFFALAYTLKQGGHIRVSLFIQRMPKRIRHFVEIWCCGLALAISVYFTWYTALLVVESFIYNDLSPGMIALPIWIPQLAMALGLAVLCIALLDELITAFTGGMPGYADKGENLLEGNAPIATSILDGE